MDESIQRLNKHSRIFNYKTAKRMHYRLTLLVGMYGPDMSFQMLPTIETLSATFNFADVDAYRRAFLRIGRFCGNPATTAFFG
jgi:hypothetical protein